MNHDSQSLTLDAAVKLTCTDVLANQQHFLYISFSDLRQLLDSDMDANTDKETQTEDKQNQSQRNTDMGQQSKNQTKTGTAESVPDHILNILIRRLYFNDQNKLLLSLPLSSNHG